MVELPALIDDARHVLEAARVAARCELVGGDYLESVPSGGDAYILKSILHGMDDAKAARVLGNCRQAMSSDGRLLVIQAIVPSGNAPARIKVSDILHLVSGGGQERTEAEYRALFDASGFRLVKIHPASPSFSILEGVRL